MSKPNEDGQDTYAIKPSIHDDKLGENDNSDKKKMNNTDDDRSHVREFKGLDASDDRNASLEFVENKHNQTKPAHATEDGQLDSKLDEGM